jgi:hypothetical protein
MVVLAVSPFVLFFFFMPPYPTRAYAGRGQSLAVCGHGPDRPVAHSNSRGTGPDKRSQGAAASRAPGPWVAGFGRAGGFTCWQEAQS